MLAGSQIASGRTLSEIMADGPMGAATGALSLAAAGVIILLVARVVFVLVREMLLWSSRLYTLSETEITSRTGILHRTDVRIPTRNIQHVVVDRTLSERIFGLGTVCITTAGSQGIDLAWVSIDRPLEYEKVIRQVMDKAIPTPTYLEDNTSRSKPIIIGLVGGIGAGKSTVAGILEELGFYRIDSDREARAALDREDVRMQLVRWWGKGILNEQGTVDRKAVAEIVFKDPTQRSRLEELVHPIVKSSRAAMIDRARDDGRRGVVLDAPLLFEAGSDKECDAVFFIEAPVQARMARVASRGWNQEELLRREAVQLSLEEKKSRATVTILNNGDVPSLRERIRTVLTQNLGVKLDT